MPHFSESEIEDVKRVKRQPTGKGCFMNMNRMAV